MLFLTFADAPSGILVSQVIDVVKLMNDKFHQPSQLLCFVSLRGYAKSKKYIQQYLPEAIVLPCLPKLRYWRYNYLTLRFVSLFVDTSVVVARGIWATNLALKLKAAGKVKQLCYDGRGAIAAEVREYKVIEDEAVTSQVWGAEQKSVLESDFRIAVTEKLIQYWEKDFQYKRGKEVVIPCTLSSTFTDISPDYILKMRHEIRSLLNWKEHDIVLVFSGSTAGWQSLGILKEMLEFYLKQSENIKVLFLSKEDNSISHLSNQFPTQIAQKWLDHKEVNKYLFACDYGIMIREDSVTNRVASPTKFAEYLNCGLKVLVSENLGDYTDFVQSNKCGEIVTPTNLQSIRLKPISIAEKQSLMQMGHLHFSKSSQIVLDKYQMLVTALTNK